MDIPLLQTRVMVNGKMSTISPLGKWVQIIFSEEMKHYSKYGYKFKVLRGYTFDRKIFLKNTLMDCMKLKKILKKVLHDMQYLNY